MHISIYEEQKKKCYPRGADCWHFKLIDWISIDGENIFQLLQCSHTRAWNAYEWHTCGAARWVWRGLLRNTIAAMCSHRMSCRRYAHSAHMLALLLAALRIEKSFLFYFAVVDLFSTLVSFRSEEQRLVKLHVRCYISTLNGLGALCGVDMI